jgi:hypothetical protein
MRSSFVVVELEILPDVPPRTGDESEDDASVAEEASPGSRTARLGVPKGVFIPVYVDGGSPVLSGSGTERTQPKTIWRSRTGS